MIKVYDTLGTVIFKANKLSKRITARYQNDRFYISYPLGMKLTEIEKILEEIRPRLMKLKAKSPEKIQFNPDKSIKTDNFEIRIVENNSKFYLTKKDNIFYIVCPNNSNFSDINLQNKIRKGIETILRKEAKAIFPNWLSELANEHNFDYNSLKINSSKSRWGSCSNQKNINLSFYCLLLPQHLIEFIMLHELCHTIEMNHSPRFWQLLDKVSIGKAKTLTLELKNHTTII